MNALARIGRVLKQARSTVAISCFAGLCAVLAFSLRSTLHSALFSVDTVKIFHPSQRFSSSRFISDSDLCRLAQIPLRQVSLFDVDLVSLTQRVLKSDWVSSIELEKKLPHSLWMTVHYREPCAVIQLKSGKLRYIDQQGVSFGSVELAEAPDLPWIAQIERPELLTHALEWILEWEKRPKHETLRLSAISWDSQRGLGMTATYPIGDHLIRTWIALGPSLERDKATTVSRLMRVLTYLSQQGVQVHHIWAEVGKKVVVKIVQGF